MDDVVRRSSNGVDASGSETARQRQMRSFAAGAGTHAPGLFRGYVRAMETIRRFAWIVFVFVALLATIFGVFPGGWFADDADRDAALLTSTYGAVAAVLTAAISVTAFRRGEMWAWLALWVWPLFFLVHGAAFFVVDYVFAAVAALALAATYPRSARRHPQGDRITVK